MASDPIGDMREMVRISREKCDESRQIATQTLVEMSESGKARLRDLRDEPASARKEHAVGVMAWLALLWKTLHGDNGT